MTPRVSRRFCLALLAVLAHSSADRRARTALLARGGAGHAAPAALTSKEVVRGGEKGSAKAGAEVMSLSPPPLLVLLRRAVFLSLVFFPVYFTLPLALFFGSFRRTAWYSMLCHCLGSSGAAFIKWGQWSATRPDMFPEALCEKLAALHKDAPRHDWAHTQREVEAMLGGRSIEDEFDSFSREPVASGSIAQARRTKRCTHVCCGL